MKSEIKTWLADIDQAITEITLFIPSPQDFFEFKKKLKPCLRRNKALATTIRTQNQVGTGWKFHLVN